MMAYRIRQRNLGCLARWDRCIDSNNTPENKMHSIQGGV